MKSSDHMAGRAGDGERLRKAREAAGLDVAEVARRLKMPVRVVQSLENEDWEGLDAPVFVRGQLRSYARLLDRKSTRLNSSHVKISYAVFCLKKKVFSQTKVHANT